MRRAISAWAFPGTMTFEEVFKKAKEIGFEAVELTVDAVYGSNRSLTTETTDAELAEIKALSERYGIAVESVACSTYWNKAMFGSEDPEKKNFAVEMLRNHIRCAKGVGAEAILVVPCIDREIGLIRSYDNTIKTFRELEDEINASGIKIGLENVWNCFFSSPMDAKYVIDGIGNKNVGIYLDLGNMIVMNDAEWWIEILADSIIKVHVKDYKRENGKYFTGDDANLLEGDVNWEVVCPMLGKVYDGAMTAEVFPGKGVDPDEFYRSVNAALAKMIEMAK